MTCKAIQQSDEMFCAECNLRWDVNDHSPPRCGLTVPKTTKYNVTVTRRAEKVITIEVPEGTSSAEVDSMAREAAELFDDWSEPDYEAQYIDGIEPHDFKEFYGVKP